MSKGIDTAAPLTANKARRLKDEGYDFAGRYLVPASYSKALTKAEADAITAAGLRVLTVWETTADRAKGGAAAGSVDGARALHCAQTLDMPSSGIIYFAVDYDAQARDYDAIEAYLRAAREQTEQYEIGVYGSYALVEEMHRRGACKGFWQSVAWSKGRKSPALTVYQGEWEKTVADMRVDINDCPDMDAAGIWTYEEDEDMDIGRYTELFHEMRKELQDNDAGEWSAEARRWALENGLIEGNENGECMWEDFLTREQLVTVLYRFAKLMGKV